MPAIARHKSDKKDKMSSKLGSVFLICSYTGRGGRQDKKKKKNKKNKSVCRGDPVTYSLREIWRELFYQKGQEGTKQALQYKLETMQAVEKTAQQLPDQRSTLTKGKMEESEEEGEWLPQACLHVFGISD